MFLGSPGGVDWYRGPMSRLRIACTRVAAEDARLAPLGIPRGTTAELLLCGAPPPTDFDAERFFRGRRRRASSAALGLFGGYVPPPYNVASQSDDVDTPLLRIGDGSKSTVEFWPYADVDSGMVVFRNADGTAFMWMPTDDYVAGHMRLCTTQDCPCRQPLGGDLVTNQETRGVDHFEIQGADGSRLRFAAKDRILWKDPFGVAGLVIGATVERMETWNDAAPRAVALHVEASEPLRAVSEWIRDAHSSLKPDSPLRPGMVAVTGEAFTRAAFTGQLWRAADDAEGRAREAEQLSSMPDWWESRRGETSPDAKAFALDHAVFDGSEEPRPAWAGKVPQ